MSGGIIRVGEQHDVQVPRQAGNQGVVWRITGMLSVSRESASWDSSLVAKALTMKNMYTFAYSFWAMHCSARMPTKGLSVTAAMYARHQHPQ